RKEDGLVASFGTLGDLEIPGNEKVLVDIQKFLETKRLPSSVSYLYWDSSFLGEDAYRVLKILEEEDSYARLPLLVCGVPTQGSLLDSIQTMIGPDQYHILLVGSPMEEKCPWEGNAQVTNVDMEKALQKAEELKPSMVVIKSKEEERILSFLSAFRSSGKTSGIPVLVVMKAVESGFVSSIEEYPKTLLASSSILNSEDFSKRIRSVLAGEPILPVYSGAIVKKAQVYLAKNYMNQISRWQVADSVHVSEDYLTSIFRKEIGISPWDYLNRVRIEEATALLKETGMSVLEVSKATGFQGQAYFCTVFKKLTGESPSALRKKH
ncbi:MAG: helix-turn-helix transcriptional regulator, partial [Spirochaetales bacterium]|nr:helix-turn-helix transcriptional regulator [Candidatus Physcosoma equi]